MSLTAMADHHADAGPDRQQHDGQVSTAETPSLALLEFLAEFEDDNGEWLDPTTLDEMMQQGAQTVPGQTHTNRIQPRPGEETDTENEHDGQD